MIGTGPTGRERLADHIGGDLVRVTEVASGQEAIEIVAERNVDCVVLESSPSDMPVDHLLERLERPRGLTTLPVILYTNQAVTKVEPEPAKWVNELVSFREVSSPERLLDQTAFYLHSPVEKLAEPKRRILERLYQTDHVLSGRTVLIVDDDIRNIFALTSILEWRNMSIISAETGRDAIRLLQTRPEIDIVLMDIMMPEMDGLDTMRVIRKLPQFNTLPIIAVTAKAMKGDREKCIEAGAWDYLSKPVDTEQLLSVLRVWLHR